MRRYHLFIIYTLIAALLAWNLYLQFGKKSGNPQGEEVLVQSAEGEKFTISIPEAKVRIFEIPEKLTFADEPVPLEQTDVMERFEREIYVNVYWQSNMILLMKRAGKYLPTIEKILRDQGVPDDFKYLAMTESGLMNVVSPAGARGFWQIMPGTAKDYKLEISDDVDERYHLEKSTLVACKYLKTAYSKFGNWTSVAASYNIGITGIRKRKEEQNQSNYYNLFLVEETSRYLFRILAFKEIFENPGKYGFELSEKDIYKQPLFRELKVTQSINSLANWAILHNSTYKELKIHNPWLRSQKLKISRNQDYIIKLPIN
ncbi:lytic transglycosylase domain-containing protein [Aquiflexum gelatinilyticum]|uniref:Lytic transglycosylase domain-containing protein n=1 Tax=Aquiflexum gelatinilyticum TaxID=2961943 RepID=A0A9X2P9J2_9BACT|nr:lytic transglycosylase domain-containing protein [Aquiflexum gelatinilyticum]MCR9016305.1 lytic transglycosylase domain-containing protein [Aquiflexum gelatinilyticum]